MNRHILSGIIQARWLQHLLFWVVSWYLLLRLFASSSKIMPIDLIYTTVFLVPVVACVYINILLLIPKFLGKKKYLLYTLMLVLSIAFFAWLNMLLFSRLIDFILPGFYFISYYDYTDLLKFFFAFILITTLLKLSKGWFRLMETRNNLERLEKEHTRAELETLKSQINPHFLFNSLNTLYSLVLKKSDMASGYILKLSGFLRYLLYETSSGFVNLEDELAHIREYIELQKLRAGELATITYSVSGDPSGKRIAPLLFLPLIENSFKHGIKGETRASFIDIRITIDEKLIGFDIRNNIGYYDAVEKQDHTGIGLENLKRRLDLLYQDQFSLEQPEEKDVFHIKLLVPLQDEATVPDR